MSESSKDHARSSSSFSNQSDDKNINSKRKHSDDTSTNASGRKKYNVINEDVRKKIIQKLTEESANIKEVAQEYGLKLSTCKAILQVYQKEGRIGKKATRDRKSKIVSTILVTRIDPMNPQTSTITPYIHIAEAKTASKKGDDNAQSDLIKEALKNAQEHVRSVIQNNSQEIYFGNKVPSSCKRDIEGAFLEAQRDAIKSLLKNNPLPQQDLSKGHSSPESSNKHGATQAFSHQYQANQISNQLPQNQQQSSGKSLEGPPSNLIISPTGKSGFKQHNSNLTNQVSNNIIGLINQQAGQVNNAGDIQNQQLGLQYDTTSLSNNLQDNNDQLLGIQESQKKIQSQSKLNQHTRKNPHQAQLIQQQNQMQQQQQQQSFAHPSLQQQQQNSQNTTNSSFNSFQNPSASNSNTASGGYTQADANLVLDQYNQSLKNNGWSDTQNFNNQSQYTFNNLYSPKQSGFNYTDSPSMSTMNASPAITPFLNPFTLNSPSLSSAQNNYATSFLSPLNLALNSNSAPATHKPSQFSLNQNYQSEEITKKQFISKDNQLQSQNNRKQQQQYNNVF
ncbi:hypothetical protein ABPG74_003412 [Tetrahymena malaccensis]